ncbi:MAG: sulfotransferase [Bacteroidetes bacterium]|nr:sulfotransferase [Bacteroidota bacterium]
MSKKEQDIIRKTPMFFIVGRPRTGSTLLRTLFDAHPNVSIPQEWPMLLALHRQFGEVKVWNKVILQDFYEALFQHLRISYWEITNWPKFDKEELWQALLQCEGPNSFETVFKTVYSQYHSYYEKKDILLFGDKNPVYSNQVDMLAKIFPTARFIHLTRDYRDNLVSMLDVDFEMPNISVLVYRWKYSWMTINKVASKYPERFLTIRYEDLVENAQERFCELCRFLEIPFEPSIFEFHNRKEELESHFPKEIIDRYFRSLFNPIDTSKVGIYKKRLSQFQVRVADQVAGIAAAEAGYEREFGKFDLPVYLWTLPAQIYASWLYTVGWMVSLLPYKTMMWLLNKPSFLVKMYSNIFRK